jgi:hypothetical protein
VKAILAAVAVVAASAAMPALAADPPPAGMVKAEGALRHEATGATFPDELDGMRPFVSGEQGIMALYVPTDAKEMLKGNAIIMGVMQMEARPDFAGMREGARGSFHETGVPMVIAESAFTWPGHPEAVTFLGTYVVGAYRKHYWRAHDNGWDVTVIVTSPRAAEERAEHRSKLVAEKVYGGAVLIAPSSN